MRGGKRLNVVSLNAHLVCVICSGYYVEATTIIECLHTFCRSCIINYLKTNQFCPICDVQINHTKPWCSLRPDKTMQDLVYKLVPGLYQDEMRRRRQFYSGLGEDAGEGEGEERGLLPHGARFFAQDDSISLSLEYYTGESDSECEEKVNSKNGKPRRYLQCPAAVTVRHLKKFLQMKYGIGVDCWVDIIYSDECLPDYFSLIDVAYTFTWPRTSPMRLSYRISRKKIARNMKTENKYQTVSAVEDDDDSADKRASSLEQQRQSEYLGNFNLNPTKSEFRKNTTSTTTTNNSNRNVVNNNNIDNSDIKTTLSNIDESSAERIQPHSEDSNASGLRIMSEESRESTEKQKDCDEDDDDDDDDVRIIGDEDVYAVKKILKTKKKERKRHDTGDKRKKSTDHDVEHKNADGRKKRKSAYEDSDDEKLARFEVRDKSDDEVLQPVANLKSEALRKVFVLKDKPETVKEEEVRRRKRKKSKHHESDAKKRKTTDEEKAPLKLKVKLTPIIKATEEDVTVTRTSTPSSVKVIEDEAPTFSPLPLTRTPTPTPPSTPDKIEDKDVEEWECEQELKNIEESKSDEEHKSGGGNNSAMSDKERLLHLRAVRHKIIKTNSQGYISAPRSLTISKVDKSEKGNPRPKMVERRPSLEIMLVSPSDSKAKPTDADKKAELMDRFGVLDLSEKSTRTKESVTVTQKDEAVERARKTSQSIMQIAQNLVNRKLSPMDKFEGDHKTAAAAAMRNLKTLSDTAVNILMAAQGKGFETPKQFPAMSGSPQQKPKDCENGAGLKIPVYPAARERVNPIPPVPNLHEIYPKGRGRPPIARMSLIKPGQNQTVRHIPNPSVLLNRQNNSLLARLPQIGPKYPENGDAMPKLNKLSSLPPLQSIKSKMIVDDPPMLNKMCSIVKPVQNGSDNGLKNGDAEKKFGGVKVTNGANTLRRIESMARNIESVAAGLTARAVSNAAMIDAK